MNGVNSKDINALNAGNEAEGASKDYISKIVVIYLLSFTLILIVLSFLAYSLREKGLFYDDLIRHLVYIGSAGGLGGIVYCMRGFYEHKLEGNFDPNYLSWYLFRPFISTITGVIVFFIFSAHLINADATDFPDATPGDIMFSCSVAFLAGFGFTQFYGKIDDLANTLFKPKETKTNCVITWTGFVTPITYGTPLTGNQLNATPSVPGTFDYTPKEGEILDAGPRMLKVRFYPADPTKYIPQDKSVLITVDKATPEITWNPDLTTETPLPNPSESATAIANGHKVPGIFTCAQTGNIMKEGQQHVSIKFEPYDTVNYNSLEPEVTINVRKAVINATHPEDKGTDIDADPETFKSVFTHKGTSNYATVSKDAQIDVLTEPTM